MWFLSLRTHTTQTQDEPCWMHGECCNRSDFCCCKTQRSASLNSPRLCEPFRTFQNLSNANVHCPRSELRSLSCSWVINWALQLTVHFLLLLVYSHHWQCEPYCSDRIFQKVLVGSTILSPLSCLIGGKTKWLHTTDLSINEASTISMSSSVL